MRAAGVVIAGAALLVSGIVIGRYSRPSTWFSSEVPPLPSQPPQSLTPTAPSTRVLDTSSLPLILTTVPLTGAGWFQADADLPGGAVARMAQSLLVMNRLGQVFVFDGSALRKTEYDPPPNTARALYLAYDEARSTIFASHLARNAGSKLLRFTIAALAIDKLTLAMKGPWEIIFETGDLPEDAGRRGAAGGKLIVAGEHLYFTVGDYSVGGIPVSAFDFAAQDPASPFGKIFAHDLSTGSTTVRSVGHRNSQGLVVTSTGALMSTEQGPEGGDELNVIAAGNNYGWPYKTQGVGYGTFDWPVKAGAPATFTEPVFSWVPSPAVSAAIQVAGFHDRWNGDLMVGSLKAKTLFRLRMTDGRVLFSEAIPIGSRIRDVVEAPNHIALITDDPALILVSVDHERLKLNARLPETVRK